MLEATASHTEPSPGQEAEVGIASISVDNSQKR